MISDRDTNFVYFSDLLPQRFPETFSNIESVLKRVGIGYDFLPQTKDIWCRDYMPIQVQQNKFVQFRYEPIYLKGEDWKETISTPKTICSAIGITAETSDIVLDGGNVVKGQNKIILTERVFKDNTHYSKNDLISQMEKLFGVELIIIPKDPDDFTGHADGMVRFIDENKIFLNDYSQSNKNLYNKLISVLKKHKLEIVSFPYAPSNEKNKYGDYTAIGVYINFLEIENYFLIPSFDMAEHDVEALKTIMDYKCQNVSTTGSPYLPPLSIENAKCDNIFSIYCKDIANYSGVLNCASWTIAK